MRRPGVIMAESFLIAKGIMETKRDTSMVL